jgi:hypothetical protein
MAREALFEDLYDEIDSTHVEREKEDENEKKEEDGTRKTIKLCTRTRYSKRQTK